MDVFELLLRVTAFAYDAVGRTNQVTLPDLDAGGPLTSPIWQYGFDKNCNVTSVTDPRNNVTTTDYDQRDRLKQVTLPDPDGAEKLKVSGN